ncbi:hypothetical protein [Halorarum salinum]|uniref:Glycosyltransferase RgtA/B/C/D-like domain-containing protein n=1 Tax=Halorarum salinum TaxID=2743089 RepID=A0A7D5Q7Q9_9EURY|nr:hypothetical protein [Halobaculum salinum]QLG60397.1 hypothetical protein HUG12_00970 [Halobaculum salinum]
MFERDRGLAERIRRVRIDVAAAGLGLLLAVLLFPLRFLSSQIYIVTLPIVLGVACVLYLLAVRGNRSESGLPRLGAWFARVGPGLVLFALGGMVLVAAVAGERSRTFYDLGGIVGTLLLAQVLLLRDRDLHPGAVLAQVVAFGTVLRFAALYTAPGFIGVDVWSHVTYVEAIVQQGSLAPVSDSKYYASPFYHLLTAIAVDFYDLSIRNALYLTLGVAMPVSTLLVYGTARLLVPARWAAFAAGSYVMADHAIRWGIHIIPTSMGLVFFLGLLFVLVRILQSDHAARDFLLLVFFSVAIILTHQISSFIMLVLVGAGLLGQLLLHFDFVSEPRVRSPFATSGPNPVNLFGLLVFDMGLITFMWSLTPYQGETFLETVLSYLYVTLVDSAGFLSGVSSSGGGGAAAGGEAPGSQFLATLSTYVDTVGFLLLLGATVVGTLAVLRRRRASHATTTLWIAVVVMLVFVLGLPLFGIENFVPGRWKAFLYAPMAVLGAVGLRYLARSVPRGVAVPLLLAFVLVFPGVMIMSSPGTPDSPVFTSQHERLSYTDTELTALETIGGMTDDQQHIAGEHVRTDHPYQTVFTRSEAAHADPIRLENGRAAGQGPTVYREYQSDGGSFFRIGEGAGIRNPPRDAICPGSSSHVYANGDVRMCLPS